MIKISRTTCLARYKSFPLHWHDEVNNEEGLHMPPIFQSYILTLKSRSFKGHIRAVSEELTRLMKKMDVDSLIFLGWNNSPWLILKHDYKPAREAQDYLVRNGIGRQFNGALQVSISDLLVFIRHVGWLTRCNAALPYIHFIDLEERILGSICQYGNVHLWSLNTSINSHIEALVTTSRFEYLNDECSDVFSRTSGIAGRQTIP